MGGGFLSKRFSFLGFRYFFTGIPLLCKRNPECFKSFLDFVKGAPFVLKGNHFFFIYFINDPIWRKNQFSDFVDLFFRDNASESRMHRQGFNLVYNRKSKSFCGIRIIYSYKRNNLLQVIICRFCLN